MTIEDIKSDDLGKAVPTPPLTNPQRFATDPLYGTVARCDNLEQLKALWDKQILELAKSHPDFAKLKSYVNDRKVILVTKRKT